MFAIGVNRLTTSFISLPCIGSDSVADTANKEWVTIGSIDML